MSADESFSKLNACIMDMKPINPLLTKSIKMTYTAIRVNGNGRMSPQ